MAEASIKFNRKGVLHLAAEWHCTCKLNSARGGAVLCLV